MARDSEPRRVILMKVEQPQDQEPRDEGRAKRSSGLGVAHLAESTATRMARRGVKVLDRTVSEYRRARRESVEQERDGALARLPHNLARASTAGLREAAEIPVDISRSLDRKTTRRATRRALDAVDRAFRQR